MFTQCRAAVCVTKLDVFIHVAANIDTSATAVHVQMCVCVCVCVCARSSNARSCARISAMCVCTK